MAAWRPNIGRRIDALYAWIATEPDGGEGIRSIAQGDMHLPIDIGALGAQLRSIRDDLAALKADVRVLAATVDQIDRVLVTVMGEQGAEHRRKLREIERDYPDGGPADVMADRRRAIASRPDEIAEAERAKSRK